MKAIKNIFVVKRDTVERQSDIENQKFNETSENLIGDKAYQDDHEFNTKPHNSIKSPKDSNRVKEEFKEESDREIQKGNKSILLENSGSKLLNQNHTIDE